MDVFDVIGRVPKGRRRARARSLPPPTCYATQRDAMRCEDEMASHSGSCSPAKDRFRQDDRGRWDKNHLVASIVGAVVPVSGIGLGW